MIIINFIQFIVPVVLILLLLYRSSPDFYFYMVLSCLWCSLQLLYRIFFMTPFLFLLLIYFPPRSFSPVYVIAGHESVHK